MAVDSNPEINNGDALPVPSGKAIGSFYRNESVTSAGVPCAEILVVS
jgi:hypothetical protein